MRPLGPGIREGVRRLFVLGLRTKEEAGNDMRSEVHAHIESRVEYMIARGADPATAREEAQRRFGGDFEAAVRELTVSAQSRNQKLDRHERLSLLMQDVRFVVRGLLKAPVFTAGVVATFAIGLGINSAVFRVADRVLARTPSAIADASTIRRVHPLLSPSATAATEGNAVSFPDARRIRESRSFVSLGLYIVARTLKREDNRELSGIYVDSGFFRTLGVEPATGRFFDVAETEAGANIPVAVVSFDFWQNEFAGRRFTDESAITFDGRRYQVIGATPRGFNGVDLDPVQVWLPLGVAVMGRATMNGITIPWYETGMFRGIRMVARVRASTSDAVQVLRANQSLASDSSVSASPTKSLVLRPVTYVGEANGTAAEGRMLIRLSVVALIVLLIGSANVANLLLARALSRRQEIAIRLALGASRLRIARLFILESMLLAVGGAIAGSVSGLWAGTALKQLLFPQAKWMTAAFDHRVILFTIVFALVAGIIAGVAPALQFAKPGLASALKDSKRSAGGQIRATRATLVIAQTALSLGLIIVSGLVVRSMQRLNEVNIGFDERDLVSAEFGRQFDAKASNSAESLENLSRQLRLNTNVRGIAMSSNAPFGSFASTTVSVPGEPEADISARDGPWYSAVSDNYFSVMNTRIVSGRAFDARDRDGGSTAIVNESMARLFWRDGNPYHSCLMMLGTCARVVGVVEDVRDSPSGRSSAPRYYLPLSQHEIQPAALVIRSVPDRASEVAAIVKGATPAAQRVTIEIIGERVARALRPWRVATMMFGMLGVVALLLASVGVYSVVNYLAHERRHEIGVRIALGATVLDVLQLVLGGGMRLVVAGSIVGVLAAAAFTRLLASLLFGTSALDPIVYLTSVACLIAFGTLASIIPALRVVRTDPTIALRAD